jgi:ribosomal protein S18 acetylase RimI-like enzyme
VVIQGGYFTIRKVDEKDIDEIFDVYKNCEDFLSLGPVPRASKNMILDDFKISEEEGGVFCGIFIKGKMIGVIDFILSNFDGNDCHAYLSLLMISAGHRRNGMGKDVVKAVEAEILKNHSISSILAGVQTNNKPAIDFWDKMGYKIVSEPQLLPDRTIAFKLQKDIFKVR